MVARDERKRPARTPGSATRDRPAEGGAGGNVGNALRSVYDQTINEDIPDDILDLLGKLA